MERQKAHVATPTVRVSPHHLLRGNTNAGPTTESLTSYPGPTAPKPLNAQRVSPKINFTAASFADTSGFPPDTMGAVGPAQFIIALNGLVRSFNKATGFMDGAIDADTETFFASVMTSGPNRTTDPRIRYDRLSGRWFVTITDLPGQFPPGPNRIMIAVSDSGVITPSSVWTFFQFRHDQVGPTPNMDTGEVADYPTLGIDANALYVGVNLFTTNGTFGNSSAFVVRKSSLLSGGPIQVTAFRGLVVGWVSGPFAPQGVDNYNPSASEGYFIGIDVTSSSVLQLRRVSNPGGSTVSMSANIPISVPAWKAPVDVWPLSSSGLVDSGDNRLLGAHFRNGYLWTCQNVGVNGTGGTQAPDRTGTRWYQLGGISAGQTPAVTQFGTVYQPATAGNLNYWMGSIMVSGQGHAAMGFTAAGPSSYLNAATTGRLASDPVGTMGTPIKFTASSASYNPSDNSDPHRWGDYSYTSLDPDDDMTLWTIQEWCLAPGNGYAVQVAKLLAPPPALPISCSPSTITQGMAMVSVTIKGSTANGAGFFEPGTAFSNHLAVSFGGNGVSVSGIHFNNHTNITADLTVAANATTGARAVTVTNPDGQAATSSSTLLTVIAAPYTGPKLADIPPEIITAEMTLTVTNWATASASPPPVLTFSLDPGAPLGASIGATNGILMWTPADFQTGSNSITVRVTDNSQPPLSDAKMFSVAVLPRPTLAASTEPGELFLSWPANPGSTYRLQSTTNLANAVWTAVPPDITATGSVAKVTNRLSGPVTFYRVLVIE